MDGPSHYLQAERLIEDAHEGQGAGGGFVELLVEAQVHATLALAAATAESHDPDGIHVPDWPGALI